MWAIWTKQLLSQALKSCPKCNKSPNLVILLSGRHNNKTKNVTNLPPLPDDGLRFELLRCEATRARVKVHPGGRGKGQVCRSELLVVAGWAGVTARVLDQYNKTFFPGADGAVNYAMILISELSSVIGLCLKDHVHYDKNAAFSR